MIVVVVPSARQQEMRAEEPGARVGSQQEPDASRAGLRSTARVEEGELKGADENKKVRKVQCCFVHSPTQMHTQ